MSSKSKTAFGKMFGTFSTRVTKISGSPATFITACAAIIIWGASGPIFDFSDTWQLIINTSTTIITFLMVFVIQQTQNKDTMAIHLKLNELIKATEDASNRLIDIEDLTEEELQTLKQFYVKLAVLAKKDITLVGTHSIEEAMDNHQEKLKIEPRKALKRGASSSLASVDKKPETSGSKKLHNGNPAAKPAGKPTDKKLGKTVKA